MKLIKLLTSVISYIVLTVALILFIAPVFLWILSQFIDDHRTARAVIKTVYSQIFGKEEPEPPKYGGDMKDLLLNDIINKNPDGNN